MSTNRLVAHWFVISSKVVLVPQARKDKAEAQGIFTNCTIILSNKGEVKGAAVVLIYLLNFSHCSKIKILACDSCHMSFRGI